jgi:hypothetical protein
MPHLVNEMTEDTKQPNPDVVVVTLETPRLHLRNGIIKTYVGELETAIRGTCTNGIHIEFLMNRVRAVVRVYQQQVDALQSNLKTELAMNNRLSTQIEDLQYENSQLKEKLSWWDNQLAVECCHCRNRYPIEVMNGDVCDKCKAEKVE